MMEDKSMLNITVYLFASLRDYAPVSTSAGSFHYKVKAGTSIENLCRELGLPLEECKQAFVNHRRQQWDYLLQEGDRVSLFPPIAGG